MVDLAANIYALDAAYKPFPTFKDWQSQVHVEGSRWERYEKSLAKSSELSPEQLLRALQVAKRAAAIDTGAIEGLYDADRGFTYTVAFETATWETALAQKGEHVRSLFEAQLEAYDYVLSLATKAEPISEAAIRVLHETVCRAQDTYSVITAIGPQEQPLPKGQYKILPNHVRTRNETDHSYAPVDVTPAEMQRLVGELRGPSFLEAHPAIQAAYSHFGLVAIHPFADGNGRVARALASVFAYRAISMPVVILSEQKADYFNALEGADTGSFQQFVDFMLDRMLDTITLVDDSIKTALAPSPEVVLNEIDGLYLTKGGYTEEQVDEFGVKLLAIVQKEFERLVPTGGRRVTGNVGSRIYVAPAPNQPVTRARGAVIQAPPPRPQPQPLPTPPASHRATLNQTRMLTLTLNSAPPAQASATREYVLFVPKDAGLEDDITLIRTDGRDSFGARVEDIQLATSGILQFRAAMFAERVLGDASAEIRSNVASAMRARR